MRSNVTLRYSLSFWFHRKSIYSSAKSTHSGNFFRPTQTRHTPKSRPTTGTPEYTRQTHSRGNQRNGRSAHQWLATKTRGAVPHSIAKHARKEYGNHNQRAGHESTERVRRRRRQYNTSRIHVAEDRYSSRRARGLTRENASNSSRINCAGRWPAAGRRASAMVQWVQNTTRCNSNPLERKNGPRRARPPIPHTRDRIGLYVNITWRGQRSTEAGWSDGNKHPHPPQAPNDPRPANQQHSNHAEAAIGCPGQKRTQLKHVARDAALLVQKVLNVGSRNVRDVSSIRSDRWVLATPSKRFACCRGTIHTPDKSHKMDVGQRRRGSSHQVLKRSTGAIHVSCKLRLLRPSQMQRHTVRKGQ